MIDGSRPVMKAIIEALGAELDEVNQAITDLKNKRWIDTAEGVQLDGIGQIVAQNRQLDKAIAIKVFGFENQPNTVGFSQARFRGADESSLTTYIMADSEYRLVLAQKIAKNVTRGTAEDTIRSLQFVFSAPTVVLEETGNANVAVAIGTKLDDNKVLLANAVDLIIRAAGVGLKYKSFFPSAYFGFLGQPKARGFGQGSFAQIF